MGYRVRLGKVEKTATSELFRNMSLDEIQEYYRIRDDSPYRPQCHTELYEIGKYVEYEEGREPFYKNFDVYSEYESEFDILSKDGLRAIIEDYRKNIHEFYKDLLNKSLEHKDSFIESQICEWEGKFFIPYYLDEGIKTDGFLVKSWKLEYAIFNLVYIYRTFSWDDDYLIYSAW